MFWDKSPIIIETKKKYNLYLWTKIMMVFIVKLWFKHGNFKVRLVVLQIPNSKIQIFLNTTQYENIFIRLLITIFSIKWLLKSKNT